MVTIGKRCATRQDLICLCSSRRWAVILFRSKRAGRDVFANRRQQLDSFLAGLCRQWERAAGPFQRQILLRA